MPTRRARPGVLYVAFGYLLSGVLLLASSSSAGILDASWTAPTTNTDGSPLTDLAFYLLYYGTSTSPCPGASSVQVAAPTSSPGPNQTTSFRLTGLTTGTLYNVAVTAVDAIGNQSSCSSVASAVARSDFAVSPIGTVNFGSVNLGNVADQIFTVSNTGGGTISGAAATSAPFSIVSGSPFTLDGVGATQPVTVRFTPTTTATVSSTVSFSANGGTSSAVATGIGTATADTTPPPPPPSNGLAFVQRASKISYPGTTGRAISLTLRSPTQPGNLLAVFVTWGDQTQFRCSSNHGEAFTVVDQIFDSTNNQSAGTCYAAPIAGGTTTVVVTFPSAVAYRAILVHEVAGATTLDAHAIQIQNSPDTSTDAVSSTRMTTTGPAYVFGMTLDDSGACPVNQTPGTGFTGRVATACINSMQMRSEDLVQAAAWPVAGTFTLSASDSAITAGMAFR